MIEYMIHLKVGVILYWGLNLRYKEGDWMSEIHYYECDVCKMPISHLRGFWLIDKTKTALNMSDTSHFCSIKCLKDKLR
jgi:hypothetical protein